MNCLGNPGLLTTNFPLDVRCDNIYLSGHTLIFVWSHAQLLLAHRRDGWPVDLSR